LALTQIISPLFFLNCSLIFFVLFLKTSFCSFKFLSFSSEIQNGNGGFTPTRSFKEYPVSFENAGFMYLMDLSGLTIAIGPGLFLRNL
jgi:hypothetical protein